MESKISNSLPRSTSRQRPVGFLVMLVAVVLVGNALIGERGLVAMVRATDQSEALAKSIFQLREENQWLREDMRQLREEQDTIV